MTRDRRTLHEIGDKVTDNVTDVYQIRRDTSINCRVQHRQRYDTILLF